MQALDLKRTATKHGYGSKSPQKDQRLSSASRMLAMHAGRRSSPKVPYSNFKNERNQPEVEDSRRESSSDDLAASVSSYSKSSLRPGGIERLLRKAK